MKASLSWMRTRRQVGLEAGDSRRGEALEAWTNSSRRSEGLSSVVVGIVVVVLVLVVVIAGRRVRASTQAGARKGSRAHPSTGGRRGGVKSGELGPEDGELGRVGVQDLAGREELGVVSL